MSNQPPQPQGVGLRGGLSSTSKTGIAYTGHAIGHATNSQSEQLAELARMEGEAEAEVQLSATHGASADTVASDGKYASGLAGRVAAGERALQSGQGGGGPLSPALSSVQAIEAHHQRRGVRSDADFQRLYNMSRHEFGLLPVSSQAVLFKKAHKLV